MANKHSSENDPQMTPPAPAPNVSHEQPDLPIVPMNMPIASEQEALPDTSLPRRDDEPAERKARSVIVVRDLKKTYHLGRETNVYALRGISLEIQAGEFVSVMGPSGSGKSTFMNLIGCLDRPSSGEYWLNGNLVSRLTNDELAAVRNRLIGFVFQSFNLLGRADAVQNVALPMVYAGLSKHVREERARKVLRLVGLENFMHHKPNELSGGQQQRVSIARALINGPAILLADEPTGNLDSRTSLEILAILQTLNEQGLTIVLVTHDSNVSACAKRRVSFLDGRVVRDERIAEPRSAQAEWMAMMKQEATVEQKVRVREETI